MNGGESLHEQHKLIPTPRHRAVRVLVVNDSPDNVESMAVLLRLYGHEVEVALGGAAALPVAQAQQPDAVLLDISMPGMALRPPRSPPMPRPVATSFGEGPALPGISG
jgi:PleD family two-component response regulator